MEVKDYLLSMPIDKVLQQMFLNFLDVLVEKQLHADMFAYRKGRDARSCAAAAYSKLNRSLYLEDISIASVDIIKCFDNILHESIINHYPFPLKFQSLLKRWLKTKILLVEGKQVQYMGVLEKGMPQGSILGPSVASVILSKTLPKRVFKTVGKDRKYVWVENFSYADDILIIGNRSEEFKDYIQKFKSSLSDVGLSINHNKTKIYHKVNSKVNFYFLGFEFIIIPRNLLRKTRLFSNLGNLSQLKAGQKGFAIILKPKSEKILELKKKLKQAISKIHRVKTSKLFNIFRLINSILLG
jgi:retron-type reverse transcriptase